MMTLAVQIAARVQSALTPSEQNPRASGMLTWINAMSGTILFSKNNLGVSCRNTGMQSARPSFTASLRLVPTYRLMDLKCSWTSHSLFDYQGIERWGLIIANTVLSNSGLANGVSPSRFIWTNLTPRKLLHTPCSVIARTNSIGVAAPPCMKTKCSEKENSLFIRNICFAVAFSIMQFTFAAYVLKKKQF